MKTEDAVGPSVSVVIPTRNKPGDLERALRSIQTQTASSYEVIVVDDGSDASVLEEYDRIWVDLDSRFRLIRPRIASENAAFQSASRNRGIQEAKGTYIAFLDHDDEWIVKDHLEIAVDVLDSTGGDYFFGNMLCVRSGEVVIGDYFPHAQSSLQKGQRVCDSPAVYDVPLRNSRHLLKNHCVHVNTTVARRTLLMAIGGFVERLHYYEDYNLMLRLADRANKILYRPDCVAQYQLHTEGSLSFQQKEIEKILQGIFAAQHARSVCRKREVRQAARANEAWSLRKGLAPKLTRDGQKVEAMLFTWQGFCISPTIGGLHDLVSALFRMMR